MYVQSQLGAKSTQKIIEQGSEQYLPLFKGYR